MEQDPSDEKADFRDTRRRWLAAASVVAALVVTGVWAYFLRDAAFRGDRYDSLRASGESARALVLFGFAALFGGAACIRRRQRSWITFLSVYTGILVLEGFHWLPRLRADADVAVDQFLERRVASAEPERFSELEKRRRKTERETARLEAELQHTPPLSPEGLKSIESISASESRITEYLAAEDAVDEIGADAVKLGLGAKGDDDEKLMPLSARGAAATRELFVTIREVLHHLRTTWGAWKWDAESSSIRYSDDTDQKSFVELFQVVTEKQANVATISAEIRARQAKRP